MSTISNVSSAPAVLAQFGAGNQVQQQIIMKMLSDQINTEAEQTTKIVNGVSDAGGKNRNSSTRIDVRV